MVVRIAVAMFCALFSFVPSSAQAAMFQGTGYTCMTGTTSGAGESQTWTTCWATAEFGGGGGSGFYAPILSGGGGGLVWVPVNDLLVSFDGKKVDASATLSCSPRMATQSGMFDGLSAEDKSHVQNFQVP